MTELKEGEYNVDEMLTRGYELISYLKDNDKKKIVVPIVKNLNRKTYITNITQLCESINRGYDDVEQFLKSELDREISFTGEGMKIDGNFKLFGIKNNIKDYIVSYVRCPSCKSLNTTLKKGRLTFMSCNSCRAETCINTKNK